MSVPTASLLIFTNQFSAMMESKLPLLDVLENLGRETPERRFKAAEHVASELEQLLDDASELSTRRDSTIAGSLQLGNITGERRSLAPAVLGLVGLSLTWLQQQRFFGEALSDLIAWLLR